MEHLGNTWCPGVTPDMTPPFKIAAADAISPAGGCCDLMISSDDLPIISSDLLGSSIPSSPSGSFEPAEAAVQQPPHEPTLQHALARAHGHNVRRAAASGVTGGMPLPDTPATMVPQTRQQQQQIPPQQAHRRIGRPIAFTGDLNSPDLSDAGRRRLKRRAANRDSARRVRQRRQEMLCATQARAEKLQAHVVGLTARLQQAELQRAQLMQQVAGLLTPMRATVGSRQRAAPPLQNAIPEQGSAVESVCIGTPAANGCLPDTSKSGSVGAAQLGATADANASGHMGQEALVTSGTPHNGSDDRTACALACAAVPKACCTVTTVSGNICACGSHRLLSSGGSDCLPALPQAAAEGAAGRAAIVAITPSTGTMRLTCAAPPPAFAASEWGILTAGQQEAEYQAPLLPDPAPTGAEEDWLSGKMSSDLDALLLPPCGSL